jgi:protein O-mannosyl-transferase
MPGFGRNDEMASDSPRDRWQDLFIRLAIIGFAVLWIYSPVCSPTLPAEWLWDDNDLLTSNLTVQHRLSADPAVPPADLATLVKLWVFPDGLDYFPLTSTVLWAEWPLFSMDPRTGGPVQPGGPAVAWPTGYHLTNVLLHLLGAMLLWRLLAVMKLPGAWLGGLLFAVHPVCVESVAWVSELKNTLSLPLFLLAATEYVLFDDSVGGPGESAAVEGKRADAHYVRSIAFFLLAMLAKTSMVAFPAVILLHAWWKRNAVTTRDLVRSAPFFLISLVLGLITLSFQHGRAIGAEKIVVGGLASRLATAGMAILWYVRLLIWPDQLLPIYPRWEVDPPRAWQFLPWAAVVGVGLWCWRHRAGWGRHALFAMGFFLLMVSPVLGFLTMSYMRITWVADHFVYLPMIGLVGLVAAGVAHRYEQTPELVQPRIAVAVAGVIALLSILSFRYAACWVNEDALWTHTLARNDSAWQAHNRLGVRKLARGRVENVEPADRIQDLGALHHFRRATALRPDLGETHNNLGTAYFEEAKTVARRGDQVAAAQLMDLAIEEFAAACRLTPHASFVRDNFFKMLAATGRFNELADAVRGFLEKSPDDPELLNTYGVALHKSGRREDAVVQYRKVLAIDPGNKDAEENLAAALGDQPPQPVAP